MYAQVEKPKENKSRAVANSVIQKKGKLLSANFFPARGKPITEHYGLGRNTIQLAEDMPTTTAAILQSLRRHSTDKMWGDKKNFEVQVSLEGSEGVIGWNVGNNATPPTNTSQTILDAIVKSVDEDAQKISPGGQWITSLKLIKPSDFSPADKRSVHAEGALIALKIKNILLKIKNNEEIGKIRLSIIGKKYACNECSSLIKIFQKKPNLNSILEIQTASKDVFNLYSDKKATTQTNSQGWSNPISSLNNVIEETITELNKRAEHAGGKGINKERLMVFMSELNILSKTNDPG